ncbi:3-dehydroquinate synthase [Hathewaya histolytica]|uniref:3-dehydroquinate synthase n=1 Tax=Hathewaya histolytica TaxID=1498 RepID=UPI003B680062
MKEIEINLKHNNYKIHIENGIFNRIPELVSEVYKGDKILIVTDYNVYKFYGEKIINLLEESGFSVKLVKIKPGEESKSLDMASYLYGELLDFKLSRSNLIISLGGGVVGDLTGFVASTYLRSVPYIQIPTSLLAQIDSSIGGKVAVNLEQGKNLIGSFYHPRKVIIDPLVLNTLDKRFIKDGMGEVIKYGCIKSDKLFYNLLKYNSLEELKENMNYIIHTCCTIKKEVVEKDEKDNGIRMILNFGHTLGHAIEKYFNYEKYTHGEAVALGMYCITKNSETLGYTKKGTSELIKQILKKYEIDFNTPSMDITKVLECVTLDKKVMSKYINLILLRELGEAFIEKVDIANIERFFN